MRAPISHDERQRVHDLIAQIEQRTTADLDVVVARVSDRYALYPLVWASVSALLLAGLVALARPEIELRAALVLLLALVIALTLAFNILPIRLALVPTKVKRSRAKQLAQREFAAQCLAASDQRARILIFASTGERYVEIIPDRATHALVSQKTWDRIVADFITAVRSDRLATGLLAAIQSCAAILETHYPSAAK